MDETRKDSWPELWLTPGVGLVLLGPLIWHWRGQLWVDGQAPFLIASLNLQTKAQIGLAIVGGLVPLLATAVAQRMVRVWQWPVWARVGVAVLVGYFAVNVFYCYALYPFAHWATPSDEPQGNTMTIYADDMFWLGLFGAIAAIGAAVVTNWIEMRKHQSLS